MFGDSQRSQFSCGRQIFFQPKLNFFLYFSLINSFIHSFTPSFNVRLHGTYYELGSLSPMVYMRKMDPRGGKKAIKIKSLLPKSSQTPGGM